MAVCGSFFMLSSYCAEQHFWSDFHAAARQSFLCRRDRMAANAIGGMKYSSFGVPGIRADHTVSTYQ